MEVKPGYKQTEAGVIPEEWDVATFGRLFDVTAGGDVDPKKSASDQDETHCYPIYSNAFTNRGLYGC
jgi:type I restriction enzyme S subunit